MRPAIPTVWCNVLLAIDAGAHKAGAIVQMPYAQALVLKAIKAASIVDETERHADAAEQLAIYGGDCWFAPQHQSSPAIYDALVNPEGNA